MPAICFPEEPRRLPNPERVTSAALDPTLTQLQAQLGVDAPELQTLARSVFEGSGPAVGGVERTGAARTSAMQRAIEEAATYGKLQAGFHLGVEPELLRELEAAYDQALERDPLLRVQNSAVQGE